MHEGHPAIRLFGETKYFGPSRAFVEQLESDPHWEQHDQIERVNAAILDLQTKIEVLEAHVARLTGIVMG